GSLLALLSFYFLSRYLYLTPGFHRLQLAPATGITKAAGAGQPGRQPDVRDVMDRPAADAVFIGAIGLAESGLRPAGRARFGEHLVAVVSDGGFIDKGREVSVREISGTRIVVRLHASQGREADAGDATGILEGREPPA